MLKRTLAATAAVCLLALVGCGDDSDDDNTGSQASTRECTYTEEGQEPARKVDLPPTEPSVSGDVTATIETTAGELPVTLDADHAPCTVNSFVSLAEQGFYDDTPCPRLATDPGFVLLQCGDPTGTGAGGPGYTVPDEYAADETYPAGTLAMANTGAPNTGGSQFFICIEDTELQPDYTAFGTVDADALKALEKVAAAGDDGSHPAGGGEPKIKVDITGVKVS